MVFYYRDDHRTDKCDWILTGFSQDSQDLHTPGEISLLSSVWQLKLHIRLMSSFFLS